MVTVLSYGELPISEDLAYQHLRVGSSPIDQMLIRAKIEQAIAIAEDVTNRLLRDQVIEIRAKTDAQGRLLLPVGVRKMLEVYGDIPYEHILSEDMITTTAIESEISLRAEAGFKIENFPPAITAAVLLILGTIYENEADEVVGRSTSKLSRSAENILKPHRVPPYRYV